MVFEPKERVIEGIKFKVVPFPAIEALRIKMYLLKTFGPAFGRMIGSVKNIGAGKKLKDAEIDGNGLAQALELLFTQLGEEEFISLVQRMLRSTACEVNNKFVLFDSDFESKMDQVFQGNLFALYPLFAFVLEVNFPDFFGKMEGIGGHLQTLLSNGAAESEKNDPNA